MAKKAEPSRVAAALQYLQQMRDRAADFGGGIVDTLADRARDFGGLAYEAFTSDPNIGRMTTAEFADAAAARAPTPRLDAAGQGAVELGQAVLTQPVQTGKALVQGEVDRARQAMTSPRAAGEYAGSMVDPLRLANALRRPPMQELDVYHGTPHRFPATEANPLGEFDASKIGTGEGAQTFGHGIYLTQKPEIAEYYKNTIQADPQEFVDGEPFDDLNPNHLAAFYAAQHTGNWGPFDPEEAAKFAERGVGEPHQQAAALLRQSKFGKYTAIEPGTVYKADLPDEMIDRMLDWDKPLSEQSAAVQKALRELADLGDEESNARFLLSGNNDPKTGALFKAIGNALPGTDRMSAYPGSAQLSAELAKRGIPGIKYLDAGSRGQGGSGTRNFVVFPGEEKKVRILERK